MDPPKFAKAASPLGTRLEVFNPWRANVYAGYILTALFALGGLFWVCYGCAHLVVAVRLPPNSEERKAAGREFLLAFLGFELLMLAVVFGWYTRLVARSRLELCEHGFRYQGCGIAECNVLWLDVIRIEEHFVEDATPAELFPMDLVFAAKVIRQFVIFHRDGRGFSFDRETVYRLGRFGKSLKTAAERHAIPWVIVGQHA